MCWDFLRDVNIDHVVRGSGEFEWATASRLRGGNKKARSWAAWSIKQCLYGSDRAAERRRGCLERHVAVVDVARHKGLRG